MKLLSAILVGTLLSIASAQVSGGPQGSPEQIKQDLIQIEREIGRANLDCDYKFFDQVEAEDFIFTDPNGGITTKKQDMAGERDCRKTEAKYELNDTLVSLYGNTAVVTSGVAISGKNRQKAPFTRKSRFTDVFVWRDGRWQIVAGHSSRIPEPKQ